jgi:hypothetical protein
MKFYFFIALMLLMGIVLCYGAGSAMTSDQTIDIVTNGVTSSSVILSQENKSYSVGGETIEYPYYEITWQSPTNLPTVAAILSFKVDQGDWKAWNLGGNYRAPSGIYGSIYDLTKQLNSNILVDVATSIINIGGDDNRYLKLHFADARISITNLNFIVQPYVYDIDNLVDFNEGMDDIRVGTYGDEYFTVVHQNSANGDAQVKILIIYNGL